MKITSDWHIHSRNSCDGAALTVEDLIREAELKGIEDYGLTDHVHTPFNLPDIRSSREEYDRASPGKRFHFGVEVSCVSQWEIEEIGRGAAENPVYGLRSGGKAGCSLAIGVTEEDCRELGIEYVVGGTHWPMYVPYEREAVIRDFHRQNMFLVCHPLVDIVAHPWWWHGHWQDADGVFNGAPWFDNFRHIPASMHNEFATAAIEHRTAVEINVSAILLTPHYPQKFKHQYMDYLGELNAAGVRLSIGSDCHSLHYTDIDFESSAAMLDSVGIKSEALWILPPR